MDKLERLKLCSALVEWRCRLDDRHMISGLPWEEPYNNLANRHAEVCGFPDYQAMFEWIKDPDYAG